MPKSRSVCRASDFARVSLVTAFNDRNKGNHGLILSACLCPEANVKADDSLGRDDCPLRPFWDPRHVPEPSFTEVIADITNQSRDVRTVVLNSRSGICATPEAECNAV